jgi:Short C-terminal domain
LVAFATAKVFDRRITAADSLPRTFRKHSVAYVRWAIGTAILVGVPVAIAAATSGGLRIAFGVVALLVAGRRLHTFLILRSFRFTVTENDVTTAAGVLPWRKFYVTMPYETIFEAIYQHGVLGHFLHYGSVMVRRSEGMTTAWRETRVRDGHVLARLINDQLAQHRATLKPRTATAARADGVESLAELAKLRANGDITREEYELMKAKIIGTPPDSPSLAQPS